MRRCLRYAEAPRRLAPRGRRDLRLSSRPPLSRPTPVRSVAQPFAFWLGQIPHLVYELSHRRHSSTGAQRGSARPTSWSPRGADRAALSSASLVSKCIDAGMPSTRLAYDEARPGPPHVGTKIWASRAARGAGGRNDAYGAIHKRDDGFDRAKTRRAARRSEPGSANSEEGRGAGGRPLRPRGASLVGSGSPRGRPTLSLTRAPSSRIMSARSSSQCAGSCTQTLKPPPSAPRTHPPSNAKNAPPPPSVHKERR